MQISKVLKALNVKRSRSNLTDYKNGFCENDIRPLTYGLNFWPVSIEKFSGYREQSTTIMNKCGLFS